jgi:transcriptional regulator with XRE-family HTH domain
MIVHTHVMAEKRNPLGPTGETVRANLQRRREAQNLGYTKLARILEEIGRPIPELGLRRIESGDRRVDADDLVALAVALEVSPITLLMPAVIAANDRVTITGVRDELYADQVWSWLTADGPLPRTLEESQVRGPMTQMMFGANAWPPFAHERRRDDGVANLMKSELEQRGVEGRGND